MKKDLVLQSVQNSVSSIFSKEDVINLINSIEEVKGKVISEMEIGRAIDNVIDWVENNERDLIDLSSASFEMNYDNRVELTEVNINTEDLRTALENNFSDFAQEDEEEDADEVELQEIKRIEEDNN